VILLLLYLFGTVRMSKVGFGCQLRNHKLAMWPYLTRIVRLVIGE